MTTKSGSVRVDSLPAREMCFYILSPFRIEAYENNQDDFIADDLIFAIQSRDTFIATSNEQLSLLEEVYPQHHVYTVKIGTG